MQPQAKFRPLGEKGARLGESPFWDRADHLWWIDVDGRMLLRVRLSDEKTEAWRTPETPGFVVLAAPDLPYLGMESGIHVFSPANGSFRKVIALEEPGTRFNDATIDPLGRLWTSVMDVQAKPGRGRIVRVGEDGRLATVADGLATPNGLAADPGTGRLFFSDSHAASQRIWTLACDFTSGETGAPSPFAEMRALRGRPDGAVFDPLRGRYWIAAVDGGELCGFARDGKLDRRIKLPVIAPTKPVFLPDAIIITAKAEGGHDGRPLASFAPPPELRGAGLPFWKNAPAFS